MIHIVFNSSEIDLMKEVIELDNSLAGEIIQIRDDFAVGPLKDIDSEEGWQARINWWRELLKNSPIENSPVTHFDDRATVETIKSKLHENPEEQVWIWAGQNQHDVCGYYWLMSRLKEFQGRIMIIYLNNLPFINDKGQLFYPLWLHEIRAKELLKAKRLVRPITISEFEVDPDEWKKICDENAIVRTLEGGKKIIGERENFYDNEILKNINPEWQKATRVLTNTLHRMKIKTGDVYLMWRLKYLISDGKVEALGNIEEGWKAFDVRKAGVRSTEISQEEKTNA